jgi:hypothetical protein
VEKNGKVGRKEGVAHKVRKDKEIGRAESTAEKRKGKG